MPAEPDQSTVRAFKDSMYYMISLFLRMYVVQEALEENGYLTRLQVDQKLEHYKKIPEIADALKSFGTPALDIEQLLRNFEGTVQ